MGPALGHDALGPDARGPSSLEELRLAVAREVVRQVVIRRREPEEPQHEIAVQLRAEEHHHEVLQPLCVAPALDRRHLEGLIVDAERHDAVAPAVLEVLDGLDDGIALKLVDRLARRCRPVLPEVVPAALRDIPTAGVVLALGSVGPHRGRSVEQGVVVVPAPAVGLEQVGEVVAVATEASGGPALAPGVLESAQENKHLAEHARGAGRQGHHAALRLPCDALELG